jgi:hypothetical protein
MDTGTAENLATPPCQNLHRGLVAPAFDKNDFLRRGDGGQIDAYPGNVHGVSAAVYPGQTAIPTIGVCPARHPETNGLLNCRHACGGALMPLLGSSAMVTGG